MWISFNTAFLSIVEPRAIDLVPGEGDVLLVRARVRGHIESVFPNAQVLRRPGRDYLYRAFIDRATVAQVVMGKVLGIHYPNFKDSVKDDELHDAYAGVWRVMSHLQKVRPYGDDSAAARRAEDERAGVKGFAAKKKPARAKRTGDLFAGA
jgi:hypothetical protein